MARQFARFVWNREAARASTQAKTRAMLTQNATPDAPDQVIVQNWINALQLLQGVPFNYLVPDAAMLPTESLRFFTLDPNWILALIDGALSVGKATSAQSWLASLETLQNSVVSGFLLRSAAVTSWPGLQILAYQDTGQTVQLAPLVLQTLAPAILMGLFIGEIATLVLQEPTEGMHFGIDETNPPGQYTKTLRSLSAPNEGQLLTTSVQASARTSGMNVLNIDGLANLIQSTLSPSSFTAAEFGMEMLQGVQLVTFNVQGEN